jgi:hypothetical protein
MPTKNPRVNVILEEPLYQELSLWAKREGISLSLKVRDLVKEALAIEEDRALAQIARKTGTIVRPEEGLDPTAGMVALVSSEALSAFHTPLLPPESSGGRFICASGEHPTSDCPGDRGPAHNEP